MAYTPRFLLPSQIDAESRGHQLDASGGPLTSPKGAIGVAQVLPSTAKEVAQRHNVEWDENRFRTNSDYNLYLGDLYQGELNKQFAGDDVAARAAYNAGPNRIARLRATYGDQWHSYMPSETQKYVKNVLGVDVGSGNKGTVSTNIASISQNLGIPLGDYKIGAPTRGETAQVNSGSDIAAGTTPPDISAVTRAASKAQTASAQYTRFLTDVTQPLIENMAQQTAGYQRVATTKEGLASDFKMREGDLESKIQPLMAKKEQILQQIQELDNISPLDRRLKSIFNPMRYDPRMLRGQLERVEDRIKGLEGNYSDLNTLRSGVAAASVDATAADIGVLDAGYRSSVAEASLLGQVAGATKEQVSTALLPITASVEAMNLQEHQRASVLGRLTTEETHTLFNQASASPDGTITVQGVKFTTGDLQSADRNGQAADLNLQSLVNAHRLNDLTTADRVEDEAISHMTLEQLSQTLKDGGMYKGVQLNLPKVIAAQAAAMQGRDQQVSRVIGQTSLGQAHEIFRSQQQLQAMTRQRVQEMFGNLPGDWSQFEQQVTTLATNWTKGFEAAAAKHVEAEYTATTLPQLQAMRTNLNTTIDGIATKWSGGNTSLKDVASAYMRGDPINGDSAIKGLISIANAGMPAGAQLSGPAALAVEAARSIVRESKNPQAGDSLSFLQQGNLSQAEKDRQLMDKVRSAVGAVYANGLTDSLMQGFPDLARTIRDPENPSKMHPFARVSKDDFRMALAHGDNASYEAVGQQMGVNAATAKIVLTKGIDSAEWANVAKAKNFTPDKFNQLLGAAQSIQMSETLSALDASHSSTPGFSAAKAYADFLQNPEVQNKLDKAVNGYGRSNFGAFLVSGAAGGGYRDNWNAYTQAITNQYFLNHGKSLQQRISQQRSMGGDPFTRFNAVNLASGLTKQESQMLMQNVRPLVSINDTPDSVYLGERITGGAQNRDANNFDAITNVVRNHKFDDPTVERIRKKAANQWDAMDALVGTVFDSVSQ